MNRLPFIRPSVAVSDFQTPVELSLGEEQGTIAVNSIFAQNDISAPTGLQVTANDVDDVDVGWGSVTDASGYFVYIDGARINEEPITGTSETVTTLDLGVYEVYVRAVVDAQMGPKSSVVAFTLSFEPTNFQASVTGTDVDFSWTAPSTDVDGYNLYLDGVQHNGSLITGTTYGINGLSDGDHEAFVVSVKDGVEQVQSSTEEFTTFSGPAVTCAEFEGEGSILSIPHIAAYDGMENEGTVMFWVQMDAVATPEFALFNKGNFDDGLQWYCLIDPTSRIFWVSDSGGIEENNSSTDIMDSSWWHFAMVTTSSSFQGFPQDHNILYLDWTLDNEDLTGGPDPGATTDNFNLGVTEITEQASQVKVFDLQFWSRALDATEIEQFANTPPVGDETDLVGYWPLDEGSGTTAADETSNNNAATLSGHSWVLAPAP